MYPSTRKKKRPTDRRCDLVAEHRVERPARHAARLGGRDEPHRRGRAPVALPVGLALAQQRQARHARAARAPLLLPPLLRLLLLLGQRLGRRDVVVRRRPRADADRAARRLDGVEAAREPAERGRMAVTRSC